MNKPKVLLDSGAYTASRKGKPIDLDEYATFLIEHRQEYEDCVCLDVIGDGEKSYNNWKYLRGKGINVIPVYHANTDPIWLEKYLRRTDYIALGAIANLNTKKRIENLSKTWGQYLLNKDNTPKVKVHGLGLTNIPIMFQFPWFSVDSFTPVISAVWGSVLLPLVRDAKFNYLNLGIYRISDQAVHTKGIQGSFPNLPGKLQSKYKELMEENGFKVGDIYYQEIRPRRGEKNKEVLEPIFSLTKKPTDMEEKTLANHWEERMRWNLTLWTKLRELIPNVRMYMGVSTTTHLEIFNKVTPKLDILISYAYLSEQISKMIKKYIK